MSQADDNKRSSLTWVKPEIDKSLHVARKALEALVEDESEVDAGEGLLATKQALQQVRGTLQMVQLHGAGILAEELEKLAAVLASGKLERTEIRYEMLMRGILQMPDYLERVISGQSDTASVLLPLINDVRSARDQKSLAEMAVFVPSVEGILPADAVTKGEPEEPLQHLAKRLRHKYHLGLLGWFRQRNSRKSLKQLADILTMEQLAARTANAIQLLWIANALVESLIDRGLEDDAPVKPLLGQVDRQIKQVIDHGEQALTDASPDELIRLMLYYVAVSDAQGAYVTAVVNAFDLRAQVPDRQQLAEQQEAMKGPNLAAMGMVVEGIIEELDHAKDALDMYVRADSIDVGKLQTFVQHVRKVGDIVAMLGQEDLRNEINDWCERLGEVSQDSEESAGAENLAGFLLKVESRVRQLSGFKAARESSPQLASGATSLTVSGMVDIKKAMLREVSVNLANAKDAISVFVTDSDERPRLETAAAQMRQVVGGLIIAEDKRCAELCDGVARYLKEVLVDGQITPTEEQAETLAEVITSIEYHLEAIMEDRPSLGDSLDLADAGLDMLGYAPEGEVGLEALAAEIETGDEVSDSIVLDAVSEDLEEIAQDLTAVVTPTTEPIGQQPPAGELEITPELVADAFTTPEQELGDQSLAESVPELTDETEAEVEEIEVVAPEESEDELKQRLTDEGQEVVAAETPAATLEEELPADVEEIEVAPLEESEEDMRSRVSERLVDEDAVALPVAEVDEAAQEATVEEVALESTAGAADEPVTGIEPLVSIPPQVQAAVLTPLGEDLDPEILEIFIEEAGEVEQQIKEYFPKWREDPSDKNALTIVRRNFHTLKGSGRMVGAVLIGEFAWAIEIMLNRVIDGTIEASPNVFSTTDAALRMLPAMIRQLEGEQAEDDLGVTNLMARAHAIAEGQLAADHDNEEREVDVSQAAMLALDYEEAPEDSEAGKAAELSDSDIYKSLRGVYLEEAHSHLVKLRAFTSDCDPDEAPCAIDEPLIRAVHTLHGSSKTAGVSSVAEMCDPLESILQYLFTDALNMDSELLGLTKQVVNHIEAIVNALENGQSEPERDQALLAGLQDRLALEDSKHEAPPSIVTVVDEVGTAEITNEHMEAAQEAVSVTTQDAEIDDSELHPVIEETVTIEESEAAVQAEETGERVEEAETPESVEIKIEEPEAVEGEISEPEITPDEIQTVEDSLVSDEVADDLPAQFAGETDEDEIDDELIGIFLEEADEILANSENLLNQWSDDRTNLNYMHALQRDLHTIKGGARMVGVGNVADLSHAMEANIVAVVDGHIPASGRMFDLLNVARDRLHDMIEQVKRRKKPDGAAGLIVELNTLRSEKQAEQVGYPPEEVSLPPTQISEISKDLDSETFSALGDYEEQTGSQAYEALSEDSITAAQGLSEVTPSAAMQALDSASEGVTPSQPLQALEEGGGGVSERPMGGRERRARGTSRVEGETIRVRSDLLDGLVNLAGEMNIYRSRLEEHTGRLRFNLFEFDTTVSRLRDQLRRLEQETEAQIVFRYEQQADQNIDFDPLEMDRYSTLQQLSRSLMESVGDLVSVHDLLGDLNRDSETLLRQQGRTSTEMQDNLLRARMVPFANMAPRLRRIVRQTCTELNKQADLRLLGALEELDRNVLERMTAPLEHMLRNAIAHGIETADVRRERGKDESGTISISVSREGSEVVVQVSDNGGGIDIAKIREIAIERGLMQNDSDLTDDEIMQFILESGFSTAETVTQIAGRGVGMDVVNSEIKQLGGVLSIDSLAERGTVMTVRLPFTLAISQALLIGVGQNLFAIPLASIQGVARISDEELETYTSSEDKAFTYGGEAYAIQSLGSLLGSAQTADQTGKQSAIVLVNAGGHRVAFHVDELFGRSEIVVKSLGVQVSSISGLAGGTVLGDGRVALILDIPALVRMVAGVHPVAREERVQLIETPEKVGITVMVVDDSLTVRRVTTKLLERHDMKVVTATDGLDAIAKLEEIVPDIMLTDIEMPRMDGYELASHVRNSKRLHDLPMIMITSRTGEKHRKRAKAMGVNRYIGKPFQESDLLDNIRQVLDETGHTTH